LVFCPFCEGTLVALIETRTSPSGVISYRVRVRLKGQPEATGTFKRLTDARRWEQDTESAIRAGRYFATAEAKRHTFGELVDRYVKEVLPHKPKNGSNTKQQLLWWKSKLGAYALSDVGAPQVVQLRNELLLTKTRRGTLMSPATVVRYLAALSHSFTIAVKDWGWLDDSPMRKVTKPKEARGRERFLSEDERNGLLTACRASSSKFLHPVVVLALSTGMRRGEVMALRWPRVDLKRGRILLHDTKNGFSRAVPLAELAKEIISKLSEDRRIDTDLLFCGKNPKKPVDLTKPWKTAVSRAKLTDFRFHDLRHSTASYLAMNGASTLEIADVLGHKTLQMVKRYSHLANSHTSSVVTSMNKKIFGGQKNVK
jgi:integrase